MFIILQVLSLRGRKLRLATDIVAILCHILRTLPENSNLVDHVIRGFENPGT
jgi:hypothetical protein